MVSRQSGNTALNTNDTDTLSPEEAARLKKAIKAKMRKNTKPVPNWETPGRGFKVDYSKYMRETMKEIRDSLLSLDDDI